MIRRDGFYVVGSGCAVRFEPDGSMRVQVSCIGKEPDKSGNVETVTTPAQAASFLHWLAERSRRPPRQPECMEAWTKECEGATCGSCWFCPVHAYEANRQGEGSCPDCVERSPS